MEWKQVEKIETGVKKLSIANNEASSPPRGNINKERQWKLFNHNCLKCKFTFIFVLVIEGAIS